MREEVVEDVDAGIPVEMMEGIQFCDKHGEPVGSEGSQMGREEPAARQRPLTAKPPQGYTGAGETPTPGPGKAKQRPMTSVPGNRRNRNSGLPGAGGSATGTGKKARPWTTTGTREMEIAGPAQPLSLSVTRPVTAKRDIHSAGVRSGAWQILNCSPMPEVALSDPTMATLPEVAEAI